MDTLTRTQRSQRMSLVRAKNTRPELVVRRLVHGLGYRYRLHVRTLPGTPDLVFPSRFSLIFVHGCFWHRHACFNGRRMPKSRVRFWRKKLLANKRRDQVQLHKLRRLGWKILTIWECQIADPDHLSNRIRHFLEQKNEGLSRASRNWQSRR